jgi:hypothetical protein
METGANYFLPQRQKFAPVPHFNRGGGVRTHDLLVPNQARYQLRYAPMAGPRSVIRGPAKTVYRIGGRSHSAKCSKSR